MRSWFITFVVAVAAVLLIRACAVTSCIIPDKGMENALLRGDRVVVNKWSYGYRTPFTTLLGYHRIGGNGVCRRDVVLLNAPLTPVSALSDEVFIGRCIGLPGDTVWLDGELRAAERVEVSPYTKQLYGYEARHNDVVVQAMEVCGCDDNPLVAYEGERYVRCFSAAEVEQLATALNDTVAFALCEQGDEPHPFVIPSRGAEIEVTSWNAKLVCNTINLHEGQQAILQGDSLLVWGEVVQRYTFQHDYYWVASDNALSLCDSRLFGWVPDTHIIGKAKWVWFSKELTKGPLRGYRWERFFTTIE